MKDDVSLVEQTQRDILEYISKNNSNAQLPKEQEFVGLLGVSRVVVREALSRLRALGIIETKRKKGTVVVVPEIFGGLKAIVMSGLLDRDTLRDLYQLRLMLEIGMADFVFRNKNEEIIRKLEEIVACEVELERQLIRTEDDDEAREIAEKLRDVDIQFHSTLFEPDGFPVPAAAPLLALRSACEKGFSFAYDRYPCGAFQPAAQRHRRRFPHGDAPAPENAVRKYGGPCG